MLLWIGLGLAGRLGCCLERALLLQVMRQVCARGALLPALWWERDWGLHSHMRTECQALLPYSRSQIVSGWRSIVGVSQLQWRLARATCYSQA